MIGSRRGAASAAPLALGAALVGSLLLGVVGCRTDVEEDGPPKPTSVAFTGETDARLVGRWSAADGSSTLDMIGDGKLGLSASSPGRPGPPSKMSGEWRVDGNRLLLRYRNVDGSEQTVGYAMKIAGPTLTLSTKIPKRDTVYKRR